MSLVLFHTRVVRRALRTPIAIGTDLLLFLAVASLTGALIMFAQEVTAPYQPQVALDLSFWALPKYTFFSFARGFAAYGLSLAFTLIYGTIAAHNPRAEKVMIPALDILQAIPVLGFLPSLVLAMIALFPTRQIGLEVACIVMIFTGQVWNMTFSFHGSLRGIPQSLREAAAVQHLNGWQTFRLLELPAAMIGLVWNSMMSMAGGWFFLTVNEAFTLHNRDFRLPGIGSYMSEAINRGNTPAMLAAIVAMVAMIVLVDQVFWRPIVVWSQRFKLEETETERPQSWVLTLMERSFLFQHISKRLRRPKLPHVKPSIAQLHVAFEQNRVLPIPQWIMSAARWTFTGALLLLIGWGAFSMLHLLFGLPLRNAANGEDWAHVALALLASLARTTSAVAIGALWTLPVGILIGRSPKWSQRLQPLVQVVASFPAPMLFPLVTMLIVLLHVPFTLGCIALMLLGAQWYILFNVIAGATAIPDDLKELAKVYHMSRWQRWTRLYLPCVFPYLVTGLVTAAGGAWNATIVSEYVQLKGHTFAAFGLGSLISQATTEGNFSLLCAAVVTMALSVVLINRLFWKRMYRLAESRYSLTT
ncbi:MAG: ABC transporter permease [Bacillota bacterium]